MIHETKHLSMAEVIEIVETIDEKEEKKEVMSFLKKFTKIKPKEAKKLREELEKEELWLKQESITKIIDFLPETSSELNKIFVNESLNEEEAKKILEIIKKYL